MILPIWNLFFEYTGKGIVHEGVGDPSKVIPFIFFSIPFFNISFSAFFPMKSWDKLLQ